MKNFGFEYVDVVICYSDFGFVFCELGDLKEVKEFFVCVVFVFCRKFIFVYNYFVIMNSNLGFLYSKMGELYEVKKYYEFVYDGFFILWGLEYVSVVNFVRVFVKVNCDLGNL